MLIEPVARGTRLPCLRDEMRVGERQRGPSRRHCERSEAIQNLSAAGFWIASLRSQ